MALGLNLNSGTGEGGSFLSFIKFDARSGRMFRRDRTQDSGGNYVSNDVDITVGFKAVFDMENIEVGYMTFAAGAAPQVMAVALGQPMPAKPTGDWKQGVRFMLKLHASCGGDVREMSANSASFLRGFDELHTIYEAGKAANPGKLPIVTMVTANPVTSGQGAKKSTNYQPQFAIVGWAPRPNDLVFVSKAIGHQTELPPVQYTSAPATGSTPVGPPVKSTPLPANNLVAADDDFG